MQEERKHLGHIYLKKVWYNEKNIWVYKTKENIINTYRVEGFNYG